MPSFQYSALDASGKQKKGNFEADTAKIVRTKLKEMGLIPIEIVEGKSSNSYSNGSQKDSFSLSSFSAIYLQFFYIFANMLTFPCTYLFLFIFI